MKLQRYRKFDTAYLRGFFRVPTSHFASGIDARRHYFDQSFCGRFTFYRSTDLVFSCGRNSYVEVHHVCRRGISFVGPYNSNARYAGADVGSLRSNRHATVSDSVFPDSNPSGYLNKAIGDEFLKVHGLHL